MIDTSAPAGGIALCEGGTVVAELLLQTGATHSVWLLAGIHRLCTEAGWTLNQLDALGVVRGPGSFTGLRVGMGTVQGLALALERPVATVSSLAALALAAAGARSPVWALLDARKGEVYAAGFQLEAGLPEAVTEELVLSPERLLERLPRTSAVFVGSGVKPCRALLEEALGPAAAFVPDPLNQPRPAAAATLALAALRRGDTVGPEGLRPAYIRASEAEIAWEKRRLREGFAS